MDVGTTYQRAVDSFVDRVGKVHDDQWSDPTPCADWDVRALVNHLTYENRWTVPLMQGAGLEVRAQAEQLVHQPGDPQLAHGPLPLQHLDAHAIARHDTEDRRELLGEDHAVGRQRPLAAVLRDQQGVLPGPDDAAVAESLHRAVLDGAPRLLVDDLQDRVERRADRLRRAPSGQHLRGSVQERDPRSRIGRDDAVGDARQRHPQHLALIVELRRIGHQNGMTAGRGRAASARSRLRSTLPGLRAER